MITTCPNLSVPMPIMQHVINVESSGNPYAIGVVKGRLSRQPRNLAEALATVKMLENKGYNFSVGIAQVNRYNLKPYGLHSYEQAFQVCPNLQAGTKILKECYDRSKHWGKAFSCYYSGNFVTGYKHGYVQKITASMQRSRLAKTNKLIDKNVIDVIANNQRFTKKTQNKSSIVQVIPKQPNNKINYSRLTNVEKHLVPQTIPIKSTLATTPLSTPNVIPAEETGFLPNLSNTNRKIGVAEVTPQIHTDSAFVF